MVQLAEVALILVLESGQVDSGSNLEAMLALTSEGLESPQRLWQGPRTDGVNSSFQRLWPMRSGAGGPPHFAARAKLKTVEQNAVVRGDLHLTYFDAKRRLDLQTHSHRVEKK